MAVFLLREAEKRPGVYYAFTADGVELPVIDVTHPAFALNISNSEQRDLVDKFLQSKVPFSSLPKFLRTSLLRFLLRESLLARGIDQSQGTFMTGMHTYLLKLGPEMLGKAYAKPVDRQIGASLPVLSARLRLQDVAHLMTETLLPGLVADPRRPLYFMNIAGGPAIDSLNALIILNKRNPGIFAERQVFIDVLDLDDVGPTFGERALSVLSADGGPLHGTDVTFLYSRYDWSEPESLGPRLKEAHRTGAAVIVSSEGGLFEYGSDEDIEGNLNLLRASPDVAAVVGSVTRADEAMRRLRETSTAATRPRGLQVFGNLVQKAGWRVTRAVERPFSDQVVLM